MCSKRYTDRLETAKNYINIEIRRKNPTDLKLLIIGDHSIRIVLTKDLIKRSARVLCFVDDEHGVCAVVEGDRVIVTRRHKGNVMSFSVLDVGKHDILCVDSRTVFDASVSDLCTDTELFDRIGIKTCDEGVSAHFITFAGCAQYHSTAKICRVLREYAIGKLYMSTQAVGGTVIR